MKARKLGYLSFAVQAAFIPEREPSTEFLQWIAATKMRSDLADFFSSYTPHGFRTLGLIDFVGADAMVEIDSMYSTTCEGRIVVFASCGDGSSVGVGADSGIPCWIKKGHLEVDELEEGIVEYPGTLATFLISTTWNRWFPFDPFIAERRYHKKK